MPARSAKSPRAPGAIPWNASRDSPCYRGAAATQAIDYWPGFVDALSTLLLVVTFLMVLFMVAQYFVAEEASGKDTALARLQKQIAQMADLLSLERSQKKGAMEESSSLARDACGDRRRKNRITALLGSDGGKGAADARVAA